MFNFPNRRIFLYTQFTDMRKSFDTLAGLVEMQMGLNPNSSDVFVFINKRKNRLKILVLEDSGFWVLSKRLEIGTFAFSPSNETNSQTISNMDLQLLLEGLVLLKTKQLRRYKKAS